MGDIIPQAKKMNSKKSLNSKIFSADQGFYYIHVTLYYIISNQFCMNE